MNFAVPMALLALIPSTALLIWNRNLRRRLREIETDAKRQDHFFRSMLDHLPIGVFAKDAKDSLRVLVWNRACGQVTSVASANIVGKTASEIFTAEQAAYFTANDMRALASREPVEIQEVIPRPNGEPRLYKTTLSSSHDETGHYVFGCLHDTTEEQSVRQALFDSKERAEAAARFNRSIAELIPSHIYVFDLDTQKSIYNNHESFAHLGYTPKDVSSTATEFLHTILHPDDLGTFLARAEKFRNTRDDDTVESIQRMRHASGKYLWMLVKEKVFRRHTDGTPRQILGVAQDITDIKEKKREAERKSGELAIRFAETKADFIAVAESLPHLFWMTDSIGRGLYFNQKWLEYTGISTNEKRTWEEVIYPEDIPAARNAWNLSLRDGCPFEIEYRLKSKTGSYRWYLVRGLGVRDSDGKITKWVGTCTDIHSQKLIEREQEKFVMLAEHSSDFIGFCDLEMNVLFVNAAGLEMVGMHTFENTRTQDYFSPEDYQTLLSDIIPKMLHDGNWRGELNFQNRTTGELVPIWMNNFLIRDNRGQPIALASVSRGLEERRAAEEERIRLLGREQAALSASKLKSEFLANMSHEVRTPLHGILGMASVLADTKLTAKQQKYVQTIESSAKTLMSLVNEILDISKIESNEHSLVVKPILLAQMLDTLKTLFSPAASEKGLTLTFSLENPGAILGDPRRLQQVLTNLIGNAIKFTDSGFVSVNVSKQSTTDKECTLRFDICDTGIGIPKESRERLFEKFFQADSSPTRRHGGSGLGLFICKQLVEKMHGRIGVTEGRSSDAWRTKFWFTAQFPFSAQEAKETSAPVLAIHMPPKRKKILVVEDNATNRNVLELMLTTLDQEVMCVRSGMEALEAVKKKKFDLVLMDCQMPELDGLETTRRLRAAGARMPVLAVTANAFADDKHECLNAGMDDFLSKPVSRQGLATALSKWLRKERKAAGQNTRNATIKASNS